MTTRPSPPPAIASRPDFLRQATAATAATATISTIRAVFPSGAFAQGAGPEVTGTKLGHIALTDAAPLAIAKEKGPRPTSRPARRS